MQTHFRLYPRKRFGQEVSVTHPGLNRTEGMLNCLAPQAHHPRILFQPLMRRIDYRFMLPAFDLAR